MVEFKRFEFVNDVEIDGLILIKPQLFKDFRGIYKKVYEKNIFTKMGIYDDFTETSEIYSDKYTLRGLHFQVLESQAKLVHVIKGSIYDVAVDLRINSPTFGKWKSFLIDDQNNYALYIPRDFAHGFLSLEDNTIFSYQCSGRYIPEACGGIMWNDPSLGISWPVSCESDLLLSEKDKNNLLISQYMDFVSKFHT